MPVRTSRASRLRAPRKLEKLMPQFSSKRRVRHAASDMFDLVADVEKYPLFVPLCRALRVKSRAQKNNTAVIVVEMTIAYKLIHQTFTSRVTLDKPALII